MTCDVYSATTQATHWTGHSPRRFSQNHCQVYRIHQVRIVCFCVWFLILNVCFCACVAFRFIGKEADKYLNLHQYLLADEAMTYIQQTEIAKSPRKRKRPAKYDDEEDE